MYKFNSISQTTNCYWENWGRLFTTNELRRFILQKGDELAAHITAHINTQTVTNQIEYYSELTRRLMPPYCRTVRLARWKLATFAITSALKHFKSRFGLRNRFTNGCNPPMSAMARRICGFLVISRKIFREPSCVASVDFVKCKTLHQWILICRKWWSQTKWQKIPEICTLHTVSNLHATSPVQNSLNPCMLPMNIPNQTGRNFEEIKSISTKCITAPTSRRIISSWHVT